MAKASAQFTANKSQTPSKQAKPTTSPAICFSGQLRVARGIGLIRLPAAASKKLPSRGQVAVHGTINACPLQTVLEPDGDRGHWMRVSAPLQKAAQIGSGDLVTAEVTPTRQWPEPNVPSDLSRALVDAPQSIQDIWQAITPMSRWEWVRWVQATNNPVTRARRVATSVSKLGDGKRRPCCFNLSACTDSTLSRSGKLALD